MAGKKDNLLPLIGGIAAGGLAIWALTKDANAQCPPGHHKDPVTGACVPDTQGGTVLTVKTVNPTGGEIPGLFTVVTDQTGNVIAEGSSPLEVNIAPGTIVGIQVQNYQNYVFSYWQDTFSIDNDRITTIAGNTVLTAVYSTTGIPVLPPSTGGNVVLTVASIDQNGLPLPGMSVSVTAGTLIVNSGFTPLLSQIRTGSVVTVTATKSFTDNDPASPTFGREIVFDRWTDGNLSNVRNVTVNDNVTITAIYSSTGGSPIPPANSTPYTVNAYILGTNNPVVVNVRVTRVATGQISNVQTPYTFPAIHGEQYVVEALNDISNQFVQWGNGSGNPIRTLTGGTTPVTATAYYNKVNTTPGAIAVTVASSNLAGQPTGSFFTTLYDSAGMVVETGFTPAVFQIVPGQNYDIAVADFAPSTFQRWSDGVLTRRRTINISAPTTFTAIYAS